MTDKMTAEQALAPLAKLFKEREAVFAAMRNMSSDDSLDYGYTDRVADIEAEVLAIISALSEPHVPASITVSQCVSSHYARGWNECREAMLKETKNETDQ